MTKMSYEKLTLDAHLRMLPVTDLRHVCDEINAHRRALASIRRDREAKQKMYVMRTMTSK